MTTMQTQHSKRNKKNQTKIQEKPSSQLSTSNDKNDVCEAVIDLEQFTKDELVQLCAYAADQNLTIQEAITRLIEECIEYYSKNRPQQKEDK